MPLPSRHASKACAWKACSLGAALRSRAAAFTQPRPGPLPPLPQVGGLHKRVRGARRQAELVDIPPVQCSLQVALSARVQATVEWQAGSAPQLRMLAGAPLPAGLGFRMQQEDGQPPPAAAYASVSASLLGQPPALQLLCVLQEDGWVALQLPPEQQLTRAGAYELKLGYREPRPELADMLAQGGQMQLARVQQVGRPASGASSAAAAATAFASHRDMRHVLCSGASRRCCGDGCWLR
jgi:hypothetical protein